MSVFRLCVIISTLFIFSACQNTPSTPRYLPYTIGKSEPVNLNVSEISFIDEYQPPFVPPNVEHTFPIKPYDAIHKLVEDRIHTTPHASAILKVTILDSSVIEKNLKTTPGIRGVFTNDQSEKYQGSIDVLFEIYERGFLLPRAKFTVQLSRSGTIDERASYKDRQDFFYDLTKGMIEQLNSQMSVAIERYFVDYRGHKMPKVEQSLNPWPSVDTSALPPKL